MNLMQIYPSDNIFNKNTLNKNKKNSKILTCGSMPSNNTELV